MKILAVRGANIASLAEPFSVDFSAEPIASASLYAITGPTGAGKSSILDAICLALFDTTPRLGAASARVPVSDASGETVSSTDPRSLLSRGAGEGFAEVDFRGRDGRRYRVRWTARRSRGRPEGRLQATAMSLLDLDADRPLGSGKKSDVRERVQELLGMDVGQFQRSVLLPQGMFAEFLLAKSSERGAVLERLTSVDLYARLSRAAYQRAKSEQASLVDVMGRVEDMALMAPEEREALERSITRGRATSDENARKRRETERRASWWREEADWMRADEALAARAEAACERYRDAVEGDVSTLEAAANDAGARVAKARAADARGSELARQIAERETAQRTLNSRLAAAQAQAQEARASHSALEAKASELEALARRETGEGLDAELWRRLSPTLEELLRLEDEAREAEASHERAQSRLADATRAAEAAKDEAQRCETARQEAKGARDEARAALTTAEAGIADAGPLAVRRERLLMWDRALSRLEDATERGVVAQRRLRATEAELAECEGAFEVARLRLESTEGELEKRRRAASLDVHRAELRGGEPCPLCGSTEHPGVGARHSATDVTPFEAERGLARDTLEALRRRRSELDAGRRELSTGLRELGRAASEAAAELSELFELAEPGGRSPDPEATPVEHASLTTERLAALRQALADARTSVEEQLRGRERAEERAARSRALLSQRQDAVDALDALREEARSRASQTSLEVAAAGEALAAMRASSAPRHDAKSRAVARLASIAPGDRGAGLVAMAETGGEALQRFVETQREVAERRQAHATERTQVERALSESATRMAERGATLAACSTSVQEADSALADARARLEVSLAERRALSPVSTDELSSLADELRSLRMTQDERARARRDRISARHGFDDSGGPLAGADEGAPGESEGRTPEALDEIARREEERLEILRAEQQRLEAELTEGIRRLTVDDERRAIRDRLGDEAAKRAEEVARWQTLSDLIGQASGAKFRDFAQSLTLLRVVQLANEHLRVLRPRYRLDLVPGRDLDLQVVDRDLGDAPRPVTSLSGGETFVVSLALALGLADGTSAPQASDSLFVDEGFGALDAASLDIVLDALEGLRATGRQIGLISHVEGLSGRVEAEVRVEPQGGGTSRVRVVSLGRGLS